MRVLRAVLYIGFIGFAASCAVSDDGFAGAAPWVRVNAQVDVRLNKVRAIGANDVWAVGDDGVVLHYDGAQWSRKETFVEHDLFDIVVRASDDIWVAAAQGHVVHFDGERWQDTLVDASMANTRLWSSPLGEIWVGAGGVQSTPIYGFDGERWVQLTPEESDWRIGCVYNVDGVHWIMSQSKQEYLRFDGERWVSATLSEFGFEGCAHIAGTRADDIWMSYKSPDQLLHFDGKGWRHLGEVGEYFDVGALNVETMLSDAPGSLWLGAGRGKIIHHHNGGWRLDYDTSVLDDNPFSSIEVRSIAGVPNDLWAVGEKGLVMRRHTPNL